MNTSKLTFKLQEIPDGKSNRTIALSSGEFELNKEDLLLSGNVEVDFYKTDHFIKITFNIDADVQLVCDRSLKPFKNNVTGSYEMLFDPNPIEESVTEKETVRQISPDGAELSIDKEVRDTILLNLPTRKIHPQFFDEHGKPEEFETQTFGKGAEKDEIDPRWEDLKKLK